MALIAFSDIGDLFDTEGQLIPFNDLPPHVQATVKQYSVKSARIPPGKAGKRSAEFGQVYSVQLWPKIHALGLLMRHLGQRHTTKADRVVPGGWWTGTVLG